MAILNAIIENKGMDIQTALIWKQVKTPTPATVQHSSLCGRLSSKTGAYSSVMSTEPCLKLNQQK